MSLARNEFRTQEAARRSFQKEVIHQYRTNSRIMKKSGIRLLVSVRLALIELSGIDIDEANTRQSCRKLRDYVRGSLGFKDDGEIYEFAAAAWRNRMALG